MTENNLLRVLLSRLPALKMHPYLHIMITHRCNYSCTYCLADTVMTRAEIMLKKAAMRGKDQEWYRRFRDNNLKLIENFMGDEILFSGGEPILTTNLDEYPYLGAYLEQAGKNEKIKKIRVLTNGFTIPSKKEEAMKFYKELCNRAQNRPFQLEISHDPDKMKYYERLGQPKLQGDKVRWAKEFAKKHPNFSVFSLCLLPDQPIGSGEDWKRKRLMPQGKGIKINSDTSGFSGPESLSLDKLGKDIEFNQNAGIIVRPDGLIVTIQIFAYTTPPRFLTAGNIVGDSLNDIAKRIYAIWLWRFEGKDRIPGFKRVEIKNMTDTHVAKGIIKALNVSDPFGYLSRFFYEYLAKESEEKKQKWVRRLAFEYVRHISAYGELDFSKYVDVEFIFKSQDLKETLVTSKDIDPLCNPLLFFAKRLSAYEHILSGGWTNESELYEFFEKLRNKLNAPKTADRSYGILLQTIKKAKLAESVIEFHKNLSQKNWDVLAKKENLSRHSRYSWGDTYTPVLCMLADEANEEDRLIIESKIDNARKKL